MRSCYAGILLGIWLTSTVAAQPGLLRVHVSDRRNQENLLGATVHYRHNSKIARFTDLMGNAYLPHLPEPDSVAISYVGFQPYWFIYQPTDTMKIVRLIPESNLLATVQVSTKRPIAEEFVLKKLDFLDIVNTPSSFADPLLAVRSLPSATNTDESATVSFRGNSPFATGIILNDIPINAYLPIRATNYQPLSDYFRCDATINRLFFLHKQQMVIFLTIANLFNTANNRGLVYNADYSESTNLYFQKRFIYIGISVNLK